FGVPRRARDGLHHELLAHPRLDVLVRRSKSALQQIDDVLHVLGRGFTEQPRELLGHVQALRGLLDLVKRPCHGFELHTLNVQIQAFNAEGAGAKFYPKMRSRVERRGLLLSRITRPCSEAKCRACQEMGASSSTSRRMVGFL